MAYARSTMEGLKRDTEKASKELRMERERCSNLKVDVAAAHAAFEPYKRRAETNELERKKAEASRERDLRALRTELETEREERTKQECEYQSRLRSSDDQIRKIQQNLSEERHRRAKELCRLERGIIAAMQAIFAERQKQEQHEVRSEEESNTKS
eukprot:9532476-Ditylum_brightwellii.AAC.1